MSASETGPRPVALVTGGSRGIGRATVLALAQAGWDVAFTYASDETSAAQTLQQARAAGASALMVQADAGDAAATAAAFRRLDAQFGRLDALVTNAGVIGQPRSIVDADDEHLAAVFRTNVLGVFHAIREAARRMSTEHGGRGGAIVNLSSAAARHGGLPGEAHYAASKGAIDSLTLALAKELPPHGIRINAVRPGLVATDIHGIHGGAQSLAKWGPTVPLGRAGTADEVAGVIAFLLSPASAYMHGALVDVSGGR